MKHIILIIYLLNIFFINADTIYLKDGRIINGELNLLNKYNIGIENNNNIYIFNYYIIDYFIADATNEKKISLKFKDNIKKVIIVKLTQDLLFYKENQDNNYRTIVLNDLGNISYYSNTRNIKKNIIYYSLLKKEININNDVDHLIEKIYDSKKNSYKFRDISFEDIMALARSNIVDINNDDFYEKIWDKLNRLFDENTSSLFWDLMEDYSNKEKYLMQLINEINSLNLSKNNDLIKKMKSEIMNIRNEFYSRIKKIIINNELQIR